MIVTVGAAIAPVGLATAPVGSVNGVSEFDDSPSATVDWLLVFGVIATLFYC